MKSSFTTWLCVALTIILVVSAVLLGAVRGWSGERDKALHSLTQDSALASTLQNRAMDAANLAVVAARHLPQDHADILALRTAYGVFSDASSTAEALARADMSITQAAARLAKSLPELESVRESARDQVYISTLTRALSEATDAQSVYSSAVNDYNARLTRSLTGRIAMLLGITPLNFE